MILLLAVLLVFSFAGCGRWYTADYLRRYDAFALLFLGEFEVLEAGRHSQPASFFSDAMVWRTWTLRFTRQNGEEHILRLSNQLPMGLFVTNLAGAMGEQYLRETIVSRYFDGPQGIYFPLRMQFPRYTWTVDYSRVLDAQTGLRLSSVTAQELVADWDFMVGVSIRAEGEEETERFLAMVRTLAEYLSVDRIGIGTAQFVTSEHPFGVIFDGFYDRATDTFEFQVWDGHVRVGELRIE